MEITKQYIDNLLEQNNIYKLAFNATDQFITILDSDFSIKYANNSMLNLLNMTEENAKEHLYWDLPIWGNNPDIQNQILFSFEYIYMDMDVKFEAVYYDKDNNEKDVEFTIKPLYNENNEIILLCAMGYDVTNIKETMNKLKFMEKEIQMFFDYSNDGFYIKGINEPIPLDNVDLNLAFEDVFKNEKIIKYNKSVIDYLYHDEYGRMDFYIIIKNYSTKNQMLSFWKNIVKNKGIKKIFEYKPNLNSKKTLFVELTYAPIIQDNIYYGSFGIIRDVTKSEQYKKTLFKNANYDVLTNLPNRRYFTQRANSIIKNLKNKKLKKICVVIFDIDFFKRVNDNYGHDIGDLVLKRIASLINKNMPENSIFARLGGEEFAAIILDNKENSLKIINNILQKSRKRNINFKNNGKDEKLIITLSAGICEYSDEDDLSHMLKKADTALYEAKNFGRDQVRVYEE